MEEICRVMWVGDHVRWGGQGRPAEEQKFELRLKDKKSLEGFGENICSNSHEVWSNKGAWPGQGTRRKPVWLDQVSEGKSGQMPNHRDPVARG